jgi:hypothetical protein
MSRKLSLDEIMKAGILVPGQEYLLDYLAKARGPAGIYEHSAATKTCMEKVALLSAESGMPWELRQAVRAVYFKHGGLLHVVVTPELGVQRIDTTPCFGRTLGIATELPDYMEQGTCTPFIPDWDVSPAAGKVQHMYVHYKPEFEPMLADFSIGGRGPDAQRRSLWMPYGDAVRLLRGQHGDVVTVQDVYTLPPKAERGKLIKQAFDGVKSYGR